MIAAAPPRCVRPGDDESAALARQAIADLRRIRSADPAAAESLRAVRLAAHTIERYVTPPRSQR